MSLEDFDALLALYGARLYICDIEGHNMVVKDGGILFVNSSDLKPEHARWFAHTAARSGVRFSECRSHPWRSGSDNLCA